MKPERSHLSVVERIDGSGPWVTGAVRSAVVSTNATRPRRTRAVLRLVTGSSPRADRGLEADWWHIAAGIGWALGDPFDQGQPPACA
jgi:hypothetical protein